MGRVDYTGLSPPAAPEPEGLRGISQGSPATGRWEDRGCGCAACGMGAARGFLGTRFFSGIFFSRATWSSIRHDVIGRGYRARPGAHFPTQFIRRPSVTSSLMAYIIIEHPWRYF